MLPIFEKAITYQSSKYTKTTAKSDAVVVEFAKADKFEVDQTASNGFNLVFGKEANVAIADVTVNKIIKVGASTGKLPMVVANVVASQDKKTAAVSLFTNFENGATYEISVKGFDEVVTLVPSIGAPVSMTVGSKSQLGSSLILTGDTPTELTYTLLDAEGNDVTNTVTGYVVYSAANTTTADYYVDNGYLYIFKSGAEVVVNAEFHTGIYDNNAVEKTYKASGVFVGVDKAIESIASINMSLSKWSNTLNNNALAVDIGANGAPEVVVKIKTTAQGDWDQQYTNGGYIYNLTAGGKTPQIRLRSSNPDVLDMQAANNNNIVLFKEGTAAILLDLVTLNDDGTESVATVAALNVTVTGKCKISGVALPNGANLTVGAETTFNTAKLPVVAKDQYGFVWGLANWITDGNGVKTFDKVSFADGTVISDKNGAMDGSVVYLEERGATNGWNDQVVVNGDALLAEMVAAGYVTIDNGDWKVNGNKVTSVTKLLVIEATANNPADAKDTVKFTVNVTVKKPVGTSVYAVAAEGTTSGNIGRFNTPYDGNTGTEDAKKVEFKLFTKQNGVTTAQKALEGVKPANNQVVSGTAVGSLFYTLTRNNVDISGLSAVTTDGSTITVNYSTVDNGVVSYKSDTKDMGAGQYVFQVYEVKHNASTGKDYFAFIGSASTNVTCDTGAYTLVRRTAESVAATDDASIRACFDVNNRDGQLTTNPYSVDKTVSNGYVHVKSITFYEEITTGVAAPYTVNIGVSLKLQ